MTSSPSGQSTPPPPPPPGPRVRGEDVRDLARLRRSTTDRKVAGVAGGIARHLDIDPVVVRIALVVLVFFGGGGLVVYAACWLLVPEDQSNRAILDVEDRSRTVVLAVAGIVAALATVGDSLGGWGFPWPLAVVAVALAIYYAVREGHRPGRAADRAARTPRRGGPVWFGFTLGLAAVAAGFVLLLDLAGVPVPPATYAAVVLAACGLMLVVGAFVGRAGGLIPLGLLAAVVMVVLAASTPLSGSMASVGQTRVTPDRLSQLEDGYAVGMGEIVLDLSATDLDADHELDLDLGIGHVRVIVPAEGLEVTGEADIVLGEIRLFGDTHADRARFDGPSGTDWPRLEIDVDGRVGQIEIVTPEDLP